MSQASTQNHSSSPSAPTAAVLLIGNELLSGRTQDTNLAYMAKGLSAHGIQLRQARVIPDEPSEIVDTVNAMRAAYTYVFTTGGIGPTHDDITADCIASAFGVHIGINPEAELRLLDFWAKRGIEPNEDRLRMARIPNGAKLIDNPISAAPGFRVENVHVMAGVPKIMQVMFDSILPTLQHGPVIDSVSVLCDLGEGTIAAPLRELQARYPLVDLGSYPGKMPADLSGKQHGGEQQEKFSVTLVARSSDQAELAKVELALIELVVNAGGTHKLI